MSNTFKNFTIPEGFLPLDASNRAPGTSIISRDGRKGRLIAYVPDASQYNRAVVKYDGMTHVISTSEEGQLAGGAESSTDAFVVDPNPVDQSPGNADKVRKSLIPEGWRIAEHHERPHPRAKIWLTSRWRERIDRDLPYSSTCTYIVPIVISIPKTKVVPMRASEIPLGSHMRLGDCEFLVYSRDVKHNHVGFGQCYWTVSVITDNHPDATISYDGGKTWTPMLKEVPDE